MHVSSDLIKNYCGGTSGDWASYNFFSDSDKADTWFHEGIRYFINRVKTTSPASLFYFSVTREDGDEGVSFVIDDSGDTGYIDPYSSSKYGEILNVYLRGSNNRKYMATDIDVDLAPYIRDTNSIHYAIETSPVYYMYAGNLHILHTGVTKGFTQIYYDTDFTFTGTESTSIANFPEQYSIFPVLYTAEQILKFKLTVMRDRFADIPDYGAYTGGAADTASTAYGEGWNAVKFYIESEEDAELANLKMNELTQEQQTFLTDYQWLQGQLQEVKEEYEKKFAASFGVVGG